MKITQNIAFLQLLYSDHFQNKKIWNVCREVSSLIHLIFGKLLLNLTDSFKFKIHQIKFRNWSMHDLFFAFFSQLGNYSTLPVPYENYLKYHISAVVILFYWFQKQEYLKSLATSKLFHSTFRWKDIAGS